MEETASVNFINVLIAGMLLAFLFAIAIILFVSIYQRKLIRQELAVQQLKFSQERELLYHTFRVQEEERTRFAANLHDEVGAQLALAKMTVSSLEHSNNPQKVMDDSVSLLNGVAQSIRRISHHLTPPSLTQFGLSFAVKEFLDKIAVETPVFALTVTGEESISEEVRLQLFRIIQEATHNVLKYAEATTVKIDLAYAKDQLLLTFSDNGKGFSLKEQTGLGILNMKTRAEMIAYSCIISSSDAGTIITITPNK